jgi:DNA-binding winged helix-turn-helix (wHTH) protein
VTKETLLQTVWPDTIVSDAALTVCIRELCQALGDNAKAPQYIETVHTRGYRFIAPLLSAPPPVSRSSFRVSRSESQSQFPGT